MTTDIIFVALLAMLNIAVDIGTVGARCIGVYPKDVVGHASPAEVFVGARLAIGYIAKIGELALDAQHQQNKDEILPHVIKIIIYS